MTETNTDINELNHVIMQHYGIALAHGTEEDIMEWNWIIDYIEFLEKKYGIKKCPVCNKKFVAKRKNHIYCSQKCNIKNYNLKLSDEDKKKKHNEAVKKYRHTHKEKIKEINARYRLKQKLKEVKDETII